MSLGRFARLFSTSTPVITNVDLLGSTFLITGSTDGIGHHTATLLAQANGTVLIHGRDPHCVRRAIHQLRQSTGNQHIYGYAYDLSKLAETRRFAEHVRRDCEQFFDGRLGHLVNNAGVFQGDARVTEDELGETWAVNIASPFLLTGSLLDLITDRIVNVTSISQAKNLNFDLLQQGCKVGGYEAYCQSKLAMSMFTYRLARLLRGYSSRVTANVMDPGTTQTKLLYAGWGEAGDVAQKMVDAMDEFWAATEPRLASVSGKYFVNRKMRDTAEGSYDKEAQQRLWLCLERQTGFEF